MRTNGIILVPVDLSEASVAALEFGRSMAKAYDARLFILYVVDDVPAIWGLRWPDRKSVV